LFREEQVKSLIKDIVLGILHVHKNGFVHRDIKAENCIIDKQLNCRIIDFGLSQTCDQIYKEKLVVGTKLYMAPEILA